jgi:predicted CDP-diglyceride synthetase/phosphatidate cytidylyltransferase
MKVNYKYIAIAASVVILYLVFQNKVNKAVREAAGKVAGEQKPAPEVSPEMTEEIGEIDLEQAQYMN